MPVTKKQGAIFAIYADSPEASRKSTRSTAASQPSTSSPSQPTNRKRGLTERKALSALAPAANVKAVGSARKFDGVEKSKKPLNVFVDEDHKKTSTSSRKPLSTKKREVSVSAPTAASPIKKTRATPIKRELNAGARALSSTIEGSPASRTRSRTAANTPVRAAVAVAIARDTDPAAEEVEVPSDLEDHLGSLVGNGRGALNAKKGLKVATYLKAKEAGDDMLASSSSTTKSARLTVLFERDTENVPPLASGHSTPRSAGTRRTKAMADTQTPSKGKGRPVLGDKPLADVSEAYGASGIEPLGFRDIPKCFDLYNHHDGRFT